MSRYNSEPDITTVIRNILARVDDLETKPRVGYASLAPGERLEVFDADGSRLFNVGDMTWPSLHTNYGLQVRRMDGTIGLEVAGENDALQYVAFRDRAENIIVSDDTVSGSGIGRPWLPVPWMDMPNANGNSTSSTFGTVSRAVVYKQHPRIIIGVFHTCSDAGATGEYRVKGTRLVQDDIDFVAAQSRVGFIAGYDEYTVDLPGNFGDKIIIDLHGRLVSGTGPFTSRFSHIWTRQT